MRIIIDLQGAQGASRHRGIGRYSIAFTRAFLPIAAEVGHEVHIVLNALFSEQIDRLRDDLAALIPQSRIHVWTTPGPVAMVPSENAARCEFAELMREGFLAALAPDMVIVSSLMEGADEDVVTSINKHFLLPTAVIHYDLIPHMHPEHYLPAKRHKEWYECKISHLRRADLALTISELSRTELIQALEFPPGNAINISAAADDHFRPIVLDQNDCNAIERHGIVKPYVFFASATDPRKNHIGLISAYARLPGGLRQTHQLVLGGRMPREHMAALKKAATSAGLRKREVVFTGPINDLDLLRLYNGCKLFVFPSWHEGFGLPALEAMQCGRAVLASNCSVVPEVIGRADALFDPHNVDDIADHIQRALEDCHWRADLEGWGLRRAAQFNWQRCAHRALAAIEAWHRAPPVRRYDPDEIEAILKRQSTLLIPLLQDPAGRSKNRSPFLTAVERQRDRLRHAPWHRLRFSAECKYLYYNKLKLDRLTGRPATSGDAAADAQRAISLNFPPSGRKRHLFVDVSELARHDARTGIQRVARNVLNIWSECPPHGWEIVPVHADLCSDGYFVLDKLPNGSAFELQPFTGNPVLGSVGDVFLALDLQRRIFPAQAEWRRSLQRRGVPVIPVVYDLLPLHHPEFFSKAAVRQFRRWLDSVAECDGAISISRAVAHELAVWIGDTQASRVRPLLIDWFHLGGDLDQAPLVPSFSPALSGLSPELGRRPTFLMVGTLEPRKGHQLVLDAVETLWSRGVDVNLAIVGKQGWMVDKLARSIRARAALESRLLWLEATSDELLEHLYRASSALIAASVGEGFGLPLIEAASRGAPIIARDLAVFREALGNAACFFPNNCDSQTLAKILEDWLETYRTGEHPKPTRQKILTWKESADALFAAVLNIATKVSAGGQARNVGEFE